MQTLKVEGHENLVRDTYSKAILNTDRKALEDYRRQRELIRKEIEEKKEMKNRVENLENNMQEIKSLLLELVQRKA
jgi:cell shape-determining protein MreC